MSAHKFAGFAAILLLCTISFAWLEGWDYRRPITVNGSTSELTDYQINLTVPYNSHMNSNFSDLRFALANDTLLPYWLESKVDSDNAKIWVKIPSIPAAETTIYMYYGNSSASSASNVRNTFIVWDDFNGGAEQWTEVDDANKITIDRTADKRIEVVNLRRPELGYVVVNKNVTDFLMEAKVTPVANYAGNLFFGVSDTEGDGSSWLTYLGLWWSTPGGGDRFVFSTNLESGSSHGMSLGTPYYFTMYRLESKATFKAYSDADRMNLLWEDTISAPSTTLNYIYAVPGYYAAGGSSSYYVSYYIDDIRVRKFSDPEPTASLGTEQTPDTTPPSVDITSPANSTYSSTSIPLQFTASDESGITKCKYELNDQNTTLENCQNTTITAAEGFNTLKVWVFDGTNWGSDSASFTVSSKVSNTSTTDENGTATAYLNDIPSGADKLTIQIGSQSTTKSFSTSPGVQSVRISVRVFVKGNPVSGKTVEFEIS